MEEVLEMWTIIAIVMGVIGIIIGVILVIKGAREAEKGNTNAIFMVPFGSLILGMSLMIAIMPIIS